MKLYRRIQLLPTYFSSTFRKKSCLVFTYSRCSKSETRSFTACWSKEVHGSSWAGGVLSTLGKGGAGERSTLYTCSQIVTTGTWMLLCSSIFCLFRLRFRLSRRKTRVLSGVAFSLRRHSFQTHHRLRFPFSLLFHPPLGASMTTLYHQSKISFHFACFHLSDNLGGDSFTADRAGPETWRDPEPWSQGPTKICSSLGKARSTSSALSFQPMSS